MVRVMVVAPVMAVRAGIKALLSDDPGVEMVSEGASLPDVELSRAQVDVVVWSPATYLDLDAVLAELEHARLSQASALLAIYQDARLVEPLALARLRAWGLLDPQAGQAELAASIHALSEGLAVADPAWLKQALSGQAGGGNRERGLVEALTERETEILQLLALGLTNKQIAARLKISAHTVKFHVSSIFAKMGTTNRVETVNQGLKLGLIVL